MAQSQPPPSGREVAMRLELVPDLGVIARLEGDPASLESRRAELVRAARAAGRPYRRTTPLSQLASCASGEHRVPALVHTIVLPRPDGDAELSIPELELHQLRKHDATPSVELVAFVAQLPPLGPAERESRVWLERVHAATTLEARAELLVDLLGAWGVAHRRTLTVAGVPVDEPATAATGWRQAPGVQAHRTHMRELLSRTPAVAQRLAASLPALLWGAEGLAGVPLGRVAAVLAELGPVEARPVAHSPD
jgi:hypothetical protein